MNVVSQFRCGAHCSYGSVWVVAESCVCASLPMQCFHSFSIPADSDQWQRWARDLWLYTSWTPEELAKTLQGRRNYQAGHIAARAKARLVHVSAVRRSPLHSVALTRTCHCARVTHPFVCRHARVTQPFVYIYVCMYIYTQHSNHSVHRPPKTAPGHRRHSRHKLVRHRHQQRFAVYAHDTAIRSCICPYTHRITCHRVMHCT